MKKILVPTDFSKNAKAAYQYALELAQQLDAQVTVVNIYHPSATVVNEYPLPIDGELMQVNRKRLSDFVATGVDQNMEAVVVADMVEERIEIGFAADTLVELSKSGEFDFLIMGATGETGLLEKVFGKVSLSVAERAACPVLLIPSGVSFSPIQKMMFATNFEAINLKALLNIEKISKKINAKMHLVHVNEPGQPSTGIVESIHLEERFKNKIPTLDFVLHTINSDSVAHGLETCATENEMDWMVILKPHRNFWQRLTHKSATNPIVMNPKVPLMVMH